MRRSVAAVVDVATQNTLVELGMLLGLRKPLRTLVVVEDTGVLPSDTANLIVVNRSKKPLADQPALLEALEKWFRNVVDESDLPSMMNHFVFWMRVSIALP